MIDRSVVSTGRKSVNEFVLRVRFQMGFLDKIAENGHRPGSRSAGTPFADEYDARARCRNTHIPRFGFARVRRIASTRFKWGLEKDSCERAAELVYISSLRGTFPVGRRSKRPKIEGEKITISSKTVFY